MLVAVTDAGGGTVCEPGEQRCNGSTQLLCRTDGSGFTEIACELGCESGACLEGKACTPRTRRCVADVSEVCDRAGHPRRIACSHGCADGACIPLSCRAGARLCSRDGNGVEQCRPDGRRLVRKAACPLGCDRATAQCRQAVCAPGDVRCAPDGSGSVERCAAGRLGYEPTGTHCEFGCAAGICAVPGCPPGTRRCADGNVQACNLAGTAYHVASQCEWGCLENGAGDAICATCSPGATICNGNDILGCTHPAQPWVVTKTCGTLDACVGGACQPILVLSNALTKKKRLVRLSEALAACLKVALEPGPDKDRCRRIDTTGLTEDIVADDLIAWFCDEKGKGTLTPGDFQDPALFDVAVNVMGCGWLDLVDLDVLTDGGAVHAGLSLEECIGYQGSGAVVAQCGWFTP